MTYLTEAFKKQYHDTFAMVMQQRQSALQSRVRNEDQKAETKFWTYLEKTSAVEGREVGSATVRVATQNRRRACTLAPITWGDITSDIENVQSLGDPSSAYLQNGVAAIERGKDKKILTAAYANVLTGKDGTVSVSITDECYKLNGDGSVAAPGTALSATTDTGLSLVKLAQIGSIMDDNSVPSEGRVIVANTIQKWALLGSSKVQSIDYNNVKALVQGQVNTFMGFEFVWLPNELFTEDPTDTGCYQCLAFQRDSMLLATGFGLKTRLSEREDLNYDTQVWAEVLNGAVRLQPEGVVPVLLDKDPTPSYS